MKVKEFWHCPKCGKASGDDWSQCGKLCPLKMSPHYDGVTAHAFGFPVPYQSATSGSQSADAS